MNFKVALPFFWHFSSLKLFAEKLYEVEHPHYVKQVEAVSCVLEGEMGYWISKKWYKGKTFVKKLSPFDLTYFQIGDYSDLECTSHIRTIHPPIHQNFTIISIANMEV
jgi:hypothetical protein